MNPGLAKCFFASAFFTAFLLDKNSHRKNHWVLTLLFSCKVMPAWHAQSRASPSQDESITLMNGTANKPASAADIG